MKGKKLENIGKRAGDVLKAVQSNELLGNIADAARAESGGRSLGFGLPNGQKHHESKNHQQRTHHFEKKRRGTTIININL